MPIDAIPTWTLFAGTIIVVMVAIEAGYRLGHAEHRSASRPDRQATTSKATTKESDAMMPASGDTSTPSSKTIGNPPGEGAEQEIIKRPETITQPEPDAHSSFTRSDRTRGPAPASDLKSHLMRLASIAVRTQDPEEKEEAEQLLQTTKQQLNAKAQ